jgi:pyridoxine 5-phosphate synthase
VGIRVSLFINPEPEQVKAAARLRADIVELHTGALANAYTDRVEQQELERLGIAARQAASSGLKVNAGHGINYRNVKLIHQIPHLSELNIGHSIVSHAIFVGMEKAVGEMLALLRDYPG